MRTTKRAMHFIFSAVLIGYSTFAVMPEAASQEAGWITLFDGKDLDGWDQVGGSNWHVADGAIVVDTMADKKEAGIWSRRIRTKTSSFGSNSSQTMTPTAAFISGASTPRKSRIGPATKPIFLTNGPIQVTAPAQSPDM